MKTRTLIFYNSSTSWGGLEMNMVRLAGWMRERGWNPVVVCHADSAISRNAEVRGLPVVHAKKPWRYGDFFRARTLLSRVRSYKTDLVFFFQNYDLSLAANTKVLSGNTLKCIYIQQMGFGVRKFDIVHTWRYGKLDAWVAPLPGLARELRENSHYPSDRIRVIPLCVDVRALHLDYETLDCRKILDLPREKLILGILGRIDPAKGQEFLIRSLPALRGFRSDLELLIMGAPPTVEYLQHLRGVSVECGVSDNVHFRSFSNDVSRFYKAIDIFTLATKSETFGMVTVEAMIHSVPVIATNSGGTPEILELGKLGGLYEPDNHDDFVRCARLTLSSLDAKREAARNMSGVIAQRYAHEVQCEGIEKLIIEISQ